MQELSRRVLRAWEWRVERREEAEVEAEGKGGQQCQCSHTTCATSVSVSGLLAVVSFLLIVGKLNRVARVVRAPFKLNEDHDPSASASAGFLAHLWSSVTGAFLGTACMLLCNGSSLEGASWLIELSIPMDKNMFRACYGMCV